MPKTNLSPRLELSEQLFQSASAFSRIPTLLGPAGQKSSLAIVATALGRIAKFAVFGTLLILAGCATTTKESATKSSEQLLADDMVGDLVSVVPQILEPLSTTIQFNKQLSGKFGSAVEMLVELGFGLQRVDADQGKHFLVLEDVSLAADQAKSVTRLRLSLGNIELTRSYRIVGREISVPHTDLTWRDNKAVVPAEPLMVAGTRQRIEVSGYEVAEQAGSSASLSIGSAQYTSSAPIEGGIPTISLITDELVRQLAKTAFPGADIGQLYSDSFKLENMTHVFDNAFASISDNYERVARETVIFPNDSQFLGRSGKRQVKKLLTRYSPNSDLIGIVGCSNGPTKLEIGNEGLALGRAKRIAEEFYTAGLARDKVFNEGCWSSDKTDGFPTRGVVIDLWRRKV